MQTKYGYDSKSNQAIQQSIKDYLACLPGGTYSQITALVC